MGVLSQHQHGGVLTSQFSHVLRLSPLSVWWWGPAHKPEGCYSYESQTIEDNLQTKRSLLTGYFWDEVERNKVPIKQVVAMVGPDCKVRNY